MTEAAWEYVRLRINGRCEGCKNEARDELQHYAWGLTANTPRPVVLHQHADHCNVPLARAAAEAKQRG